MRSRYANPDMWVDTVDRAVKTWAATAVSLVGSNALDVTSVDWFQLLNISAGAALVSVLTSIATARPVP